LGDDIRLRKKLNARGREKKICLKKGGGFALERWYLFEKKLNARGREKKIFVYF